MDTDLYRARITEGNPFLSGLCSTFQALSVHHHSLVLCNQLKIISLSCFAYLKLPIFTFILRVNVFFVVITSTFII